MSAGKKRRRAVVVAWKEIGRGVDWVAALVWEGHGWLWWMGLVGCVVVRWIEWVGGRMRAA